MIGETYLQVHKNSNPLRLYAVSSSSRPSGEYLETSQYQLIIQSSSKVNKSPPVQLLFQIDSLSMPSQFRISTRSNESQATHSAYSKKRAEVLINPPHKIPMLPGTFLHALNLLQGPGHHIAVDVTRATILSSQKISRFTSLKICILETISIFTDPTRC